MAEQALREASAHRRSRSWDEEPRLLLGDREQAASKDYDNGGDDDEGEDRRDRTRGANELAAEENPGSKMHHCPRSLLVVRGCLLHDISYKRVAIIAEEVVHLSVIRAGDSVQSQIVGLWIGWAETNEPSRVTEGENTPTYAIWTRKVVYYAIAVADPHVTNEG